MDWYKRYIGDYQRDTGHLSLAQHGAYTVLLDHYYAKQQALPVELTALNHLCRATTALERGAVRKVADEFFPVRNGSRRNARADEEIGKLEFAAAQNVAAGKRGAEVRWGKRNDGDPNGDPTHSAIGEQHGENHGDPNGDPNSDPNGVRHDSAIPSANGETMASQSPDSRLKNSVPLGRLNPAKRVVAPTNPSRNGKKGGRVQEPEQERLRKALVILESEPDYPLDTLAQMYALPIDTIRQARDA